MKNIMRGINMKAIRTMVFKKAQNYKEGDVIENMKHWSAEGGEYTDPDLDNTYTYLFECCNLEGEEIDYDRIDEDEDYERKMYDLGINTDCSDEKEIYVEPSVKFRVVEVEEMQDWTEEYGTETYIQNIKVEMIKER